MTELAVAAIPDPPLPGELFSRLAELPLAVWLDSAADVAGTGRWSFIAVEPFAVLRSDAGGTSWVWPDRVEPVDDSPFTVLDDALRRMGTHEAAPLPFAGGAVGFISYEAAREFERLPEPRVAPAGLPVVHLAFFDVVIGWDHVTGECHVVSTGRPEVGAAARGRARERLAETLELIAGGPPPNRWPIDVIGRSPAIGASVGSDESPSVEVAGIPWLRSTVSRTDYLRAVESIIEAIEEGDVYQVNLSQRFSAATGTTPLALYDRLRARSPAPYGAFVRLGTSSLMSTSPERFLSVADGVVETRPIKGTRPRGPDPESDARMVDELLASEKDRAENLMIVDLLRNDLARVCRPGTIEVPQLFGLESWATVHHLVSVVRGRLRQSTSAAALLRATFPCGSVTGAPKIRAMELIAETEHVARGPYCGAIGYFAFGGRIELSVAIRILTLDDSGHALFHAGGGIVFDSVPLDEYEETLAKAGAIIGAIEQGRRVGATT